MDTTGKYEESFLGASAQGPENEKCPAATRRAESLQDMLKARSLPIGASGEP